MPLAKLPLTTSLRVRTLTTSAPRMSGLSATAQSRAEKISHEWKGTSATGGNTKNFVGGEFVESKADKWIDVHDPVCTAALHRSILCLTLATQATQTVLTRVPETTSTEFQQAVDAASHAFKTWSRTSVLTRQRFVMECVAFEMGCGKVLSILQSTVSIEAEWRCHREQYRA